jgi:hypothetical protein
MPEPRGEFLEMIKALQKLPPGDRHYSVFQVYGENVEHRWCSTSEIFQAAYGDPVGAEYWRGWFEKE